MKFDPVLETESGTGDQSGSRIKLQFYSHSILQNVLWRKKLQDQRKMLFELAVESAVANPEVQQFVCPNIQRSRWPVLSQTAALANQLSANSMFRDRAVQLAASLATTGGVTPSIQAGITSARLPSR
ncbi:hypothetical protein quinque_014158 [Culex quinquefasciatus]